MIHKALMPDKRQNTRLLMGGNMNYIRTVLPLTLTLLLAACGGDGPTPTPPAPPVEQPPAPPEPPVTPPVAPPVTPAPPPPPVTPPPPETNTEYYGEWLWTFTFDRTESVLTGQISVTEDAFTDSFSGSRGPYQLCAEDGTCDAVVKFGTGLIGTFELDDGDRLGMGLFNDLGGDGFVQLIGYDSDGRLEVNERGEDELSGDGLWAFGSTSDGYLGTFTLVKISDLPVFQ